MSRFKRTTPAPVVSGTGYNCFRPHVRADFEQCCAYCYLHEDHIGGSDHFDLDHFRPKTLFPDRINDFYNLYWRCKACNMHKHHDWPGEEVLELGIGYVDLCEGRFEDHYVVLPDGAL